MPEFVAAAKRSASEAANPSGSVTARAAVPSKNVRWAI